MKRIATFLLVAALSAAGACVETPQQIDNNDRPGRGIDRTVDGNDIVVDGDGIARAELWLSDVANVRTLGVAVRIEGADVLEWERDDALFTRNGGRVIPLESRVKDDTFRMIAGTTAPASASAEGVRLASFTFKQRAGETLRLSMVEEGSDLGAVDTSGTRIDIARAGNLSFRSGGAQ
jgi:hypothetical protein